MENIIIKPDGINPITNRPYVFLDEETRNKFNQDYSRFGTIEERAKRLKWHICRSINDDDFRSLISRYGLSKEEAIVIKTKNNYEKSINWINKTNEISILVKDNFELLIFFEYIPDGSIRDWG